MFPEWTQKKGVSSWTISYHLTKTKKEYKNFKETENSKYIYQKKLDKAYFQHCMAFVDYKDLPRRTASDEILQDIVFNNVFTKYS